MFSKIKQASYTLSVFTFFAFITSGAGFVTYQLYVNYFPEAQAQAATMSGGEMGAMGEGSDSVLYILRSQDTVAKMQEMGFAAYDYDERLEKFAALYRQKGFLVEQISEVDLDKIPTNAAVFAFDTIGLSIASATRIKRFVADGGFLFFNFHFGFHSEEGYRANALVKELTQLDYVQDVPYLELKELLYLTPRVLSPITQKVIPQATKIGVEIYDAVPVFEHPSLRADIIGSNWLTRAPLVVTTEEGSERTLTPSESGFMWHGRYGKGKWVYSSLPSYSLFSSPDHNQQLNQLMSGVAEYSQAQLMAVTFPYIDSERAIFVSEDTEYRFESFHGFIQAANRYKIPTTAFVVAELAEKNQDLMDDAATSPYIEMASHSYTHSKIMGEASDKIEKEIAGSKALIDKIAGSQLKGFRPPREEMDDEMYQVLVDAGYNYILGATTDSLYPIIQPERNNLVFLPRTATDDYQYLVNLDWNPEQILDRMKLEAKHLTQSDGLFSLSVHTHLMAYKSNIKVVEQFFEFLKENPELKPYSGQQLVERIHARNAVQFDVEKTRRNFLVRLSNDADKTVEQLHFRLYWPAGKTLGNIRTELVGTNVGFTHYPLRGYTDVTIDHVAPRALLSMIIPFDDESL